MKRIILTIVAALSIVAASAHGKDGKFSKEKFKQDVKAFIIKESGMTREEACKFFPVFYEMKKQQRAVFEQIRQIDKAQPKTEAEYAEAIKKRDALNIESKKIEQRYNLKLMKIVPASKLLKAIKAEDRFHRKALKRFNNGAKPKRK